MSVVRYGDSKAIFGEIPKLPVVVPDDVVRWKIRTRPERFAMIFLKFNNRIEEWYLGQNEDILSPYIKRSENRSR